VVADKVDKVLFVGPLDRVLFLRTLPILEGAAPQHLAAVAQHARERFFPKGNLLLRRGEPAEAAYLVVEGRVAMTRDGRSESLGPGEAVGFLQLLARAEHEVEARAEEDTLVLALDWNAQLDVCEEHFPVLMHYIRYLCLRTLDELRGSPAGALPDYPTDLVGVPLRPLNLVERILVLSRARAFSVTTLDALTELAHHVDEVRLRPGEPAWRTGDAADHFLLVASGIVRSHVPGGGRFRSGPGLTVGMPEALRGEPRWYDAGAESAVAGLRIAVEPFVDILEDHFDMAVDFTSVLARRVMELGAGG
jgi:CRP-like cAMP-binding protein